MEAHAARTLDEAGTIEPGIIVYGCTASSAVGDPDGYERDLNDKAGYSAVTEKAALVSAFKPTASR